MGQAKARGTREQRIVQAIERRKAEDAARHEQYLRDEEARRERLRKLPAQERKEVLLAGGGYHTAALMAALLASGARIPHMPIIAYKKEAK